VNGLDYFSGNLDEFRMWNRALTSQEILLLNNSYCFTDSIENTICDGDSISINNKDFYHLTGTYTDTLFGSSLYGCDSVVTLKLNVLQKSYSKINGQICEGDTFNFNGRQLSQTGTYF